MRLLILTQKVDKDDPVLGFFHNWLAEFSKKFEKISVVCLEKGAFDLPGNVKVYSLGKESKRSKTKYLLNFFRYVIGLCIEYDAVFVHMNQEYVLLGGFIWKVLGKKVYLWRNHLHGNFFTKISVWLSCGVFCTSQFAYVAKYKKTEIMPVGIDAEVFKCLKIERLKNSILFLGRISPIKKPDLLIEALNVLRNKGTDFTCDFCGDASSKDQNYFDSLKMKTKELGLEEKVNFHKGMPNHETPKIYNRHEIFVNLTPSGSFDKTILEAAACGCILVVANQSLVGEIDDRMITKNDTPENITEAINFWLGASNEQKNTASKKLQNYVLEKHSLTALTFRLSESINKELQ